jgi:UDP-N-acetylglucosamine acyltransferase
MAYSHIAHDCQIGNDCIIANAGTLAGHVSIEDRAIIGGLVAIHQFVRVGPLSIIGGCSKVVQDVPPYATCDGHPTKVYGLNLVGLKRANFSKESLLSLKRAFKFLFYSGLSISHALEKIEKELPLLPEIQHLISFIKNSQRGICR